MAEANGPIRDGGSRRIAASVKFVKTLLRQRKTIAFGVVGGLGAFLGSAVGYRVFGDGSLVRVAGWDAFIGLGIGAAITLAQNANLHRIEIVWRDALHAAKRFAAAGAAGGVVLLVVKSLMGGGLTGHTAGWAAEGLVIAALLAQVLPNLPRRHAMLAGTIGGASGAIFGLALGAPFGSALGVALADALKGAMLGIALSVSEGLRAISSASLLIHWGKGETSLVLLGEQPIRFGNTAHCRVYVRGNGGEAPCEFAEVSIVSGRVVVRNLRGHHTFHVRDGESFTIEGIRIEVRAGRNAQRLPPEPRISAWRTFRPEGNILNSDGAKPVSSIKTMHANLEAVVSKLSGFVRRHL